MKYKVYIPIRQHNIFYVYAGSKATAVSAAVGRSNFEEPDEIEYLSDGDSDPAWAEKVKDDQENL